VVKYATARHDNIIWRMRFACRVTMERIQTHILNTEYLLMLTAVRNPSTTLQGNPLLCCHGNTEHVYVADNYIYAINNKK
jgi:hypothetical protein